jgi:predicted  nucleic acid-binding Zn-ribbon protein
MNLGAHQIIDHCQQQFNALLNRYEQAEYSVLLQYFGPLDQGRTYEISNEIEELLNKTEESRSTIKRIFSILIEALQNIRLHSLKNVVQDQLAGVIVARKGKLYEINIINLADENSKLILQNRIEAINGMSTSDLKRSYLETMTDGVISDKGGAGLGIITIAMKSKQKIEFDFHRIAPGLYIFEIRFGVESGS